MGSSGPFAAQSQTAAFRYDLGGQQTPAGDPGTLDNDS